MHTPFPANHIRHVRQPDRKALLDSDAPSHLADPIWYGLAVYTGCSALGGGQNEASTALVIHPADELVLPPPCHDPGGAPRQ